MENANNVNTRAPRIDFESSDAVRRWATAKNAAIDPADRYSSFNFSLPEFFAKAKEKVWPDSVDALAREAYSQLPELRSPAWFDAWRQELGGQMPQFELPDFLRDAKEKTLPNAVEAGNAFLSEYPAALRNFGASLPSYFASEKPNLSGAGVDALMERAAAQNRGKFMRNAALLSLGVGGSIAAAQQLAKWINRKSVKKPNTYTMPTEATVFTPEAAAEQSKKKKKKRKRRRKSQSKQASSFYDQMLLAMEKPWENLPAVALAGGGLGLGIYGGNKLIDKARQRLRQRRLVRSRLEFEDALKDLAEAGLDEKKRAAAPVDEDMRQLAINCQKLAFLDDVLFRGRLAALLPWLAAGGLGGIGLLGYRHGMQGKKDDLLDYAERRVNIDRQKYRPGHTRARLVEAKKDEESAEEKAEARSQMMEMLEQELPYL